MRTLTLIAALLLAPAAHADNTGGTAKTSDTAKPAKLTKDELQVVAHYHALNLKELDLGKYALKTTKSEGIKDYARMLIKDHGDSDKQLKTLAKARGQVIPTEKPMTDDDKREMAEAKTNAAKVKKLKGADFDAAYLIAMVDGHEKELSKVDAMAARAEDPELKESVLAKRKTLQHHADAARELQKTGPQASR